MPEITLIPKRERPELKISFGKFLFYCPLILLILVILISSGFYLYNATLNRSIKLVEDEIKSIESQRDALKDEEFLKEIFNLSTRVRNLKHALDNHIYFTNLLAFFEKLTLPKTSYKGFNVQLGGAISTGGTTESYAGLIKQMIVFSRNPGVEGASIGDISLSPTGQVGFSLSLSFDQKILLKK